MSDYQSHAFKVSRTAHYYTLGTPSAAIEDLYIVCHGYGQLGSEIIHKFKAFDNGKNLIIAPEGLSRFYWGGVTGKVAASWMTKGDRLDEIEDFVNMMQTIYEQYTRQLSPDVKIHLFGFSQGVATIIRWVMARFPKVNRFILWAGTWPDDLDYRPHQEYFSEKEIHWHCGHSDEYVTDNRLKWHRNFVRKNGLKMTEHWFDGKHVIPRSELEKIYL